MQNLVSCLKTVS